MTKSNCIQEFERLLERFQQLPKTQPNPETILEVSGFPHFEIASSNILAFFLDPNNEHGFKGLVLRSLVETVRPELVVSDLRSVKVKCEDRTDSNKSIDLVVVSDAFVLGIENKIYASVYNPFDEYTERLKTLAEKNEIAPENIVRILLSLRPESDQSGFKAVTYEKFFSSLQQHLGGAISRADTRWVVFLIDFMRTIQNLKEGHMTPELGKFFRENEESVHHLHLKIPQLIQHLESKAKPVWDSIKVAKLPKGITKLKRSDASEDSRRKYFAYSIWVEADLGDSHKLGLEAVIRLSGWQILAWPASDEAVKQAKKFVKNSGMNFKADTEFPEAWQFDKQLSYQESPKIVSKKFCDFVASVCAKLPKT